MTSSAITSDTATGERADLLKTLGQHRFFLRFTARDLDDAQAARPTTVSALTIGGLIKHVRACEATWAAFIVDGAAAFGRQDMTSFGEEQLAQREREFRMQPGETIQSLLHSYEQVSAATDALVAELPDFDASHPLPEAPWFEAGAHWSARRVLLHIIAETAQHAGHADIIREALDGAKTMG
jgi:Protein of unknown function (DUF664)